MTLHTIISISAIVLYLLDMLWFVIRLIKNGKPKASSEKGFVPRQVCIYIASVAIIVLCIFIEFGTMGDFVLNACALLACEIANRQWLIY
ncbi:MAG: hypothetical protein K5681_10105 [Treponema sp.]|nr:hypothetical protein [Treponema sp.]